MDIKESYGQLVLSVIVTHITSYLCAQFHRVWQELPVLVIVSMLAYFCFLEQLLVRITILS